MTTNQGKLGILLIEDNPGDARLIQEILTGAHEAAGPGAPAFTLTIADRLSAGLAQLAEVKPDVILLDLSLPDSQGLNTIVSVVARAPGVAVVVLTGLEDEAMAVKALQEGAQDYLLKGQMEAGLLARAVRYAVERKRAEEALRDSEKHFRALIENFSDAVTLVNADGIILYESPAVTRMLGHAPAELVGTNGFDRVHPDDLQLATSLFAELLQNPGRSPTGQFRLRHRDGSWRWVEAVGANLLADPSVRAIVANYRDVTQRVRTQQRQAAHHAITRILAESATEAEAAPKILQAVCESLELDYGELWSVWWDVDRRANVLRCLETWHTHSASFTEFDSVTRQTTFAPGVGLPGRVWASRIPAWIADVTEDTNFPRAAFAAKDGLHTALGFPFMLSGEVLGVMAYLSREVREPDDDLLQTLAGIGMQIGQFVERKQAEEALRESEARYRSLFENMRDGFAYCKMLYENNLPQDFVYLDVNSAFEDLTGLKNVVGRKVTEVITGIRESNPELFEIYGRVALSGKPERFETYVAPLGIWLSISVYCPQREHFVAVFDNITGRKRAEQELKLFRTLIDRSNDAIEVIDPETGRYLDMNEKAWQNLGYSRQELLSLTVFDVDPSIEQSSFPKIVQGLRTSGFMLWEGYHQRKDGSTFPVEVNIKYVQLDRGYAVTVVRDITERKAAEEEVRRRLAELEAVNRVSTAMRAAQSLDEMLPLLLDETLAVLGTDTGAIWLHGESGADELRPAASRGWHTLIDDKHLRAGEGIAGTVFATGAAHVSREFVTDPLTSDLARTLIPAGWGGACVPIRTAHLLVGVVFVSVQVPRVVTAGEVNLLTTLAEIAGNAIHRTRLHEQTQKRLQRLDALRAIDQAISASVDLRVTFDVLLGQVTSRLGVDAADLLLLNPPAHVLEYAAGHGFRTTSITRSRLRLGEGHAGRAALERRRLSIPDLSAAGDQFVRAPLLAGESFVAHHVTPLIAKGQVKGVLEVFHRSPLDTDPEWREFFEALAGQAAIAIDNATLFDGLQRSNLELALAYDATIEGWSRALDLRDKETEGHTQRVAELTLQLARTLGMSESELVHVRRGALLHDIGKMGIPDAILLKAGPLSDDEWATMRRHPTYAYDMLSPIAYLRPALDIPHCHHEKWDGTGYPRGLNGDQIPLAARLFAVVDVWDALLSDRPYRAAWHEDKARQYIREQAGKHFDPHIAQAFLDLEGV